ncbi:hypothetical protein [Pseudomonas anguilliseptica]|uniref:hypothetical protein n=1 Tax=Pseudomonas anguilliseptica TaxID=53406 RepID=UPI0022AF549E|nr:hypothetical protein [Pseudomonas anguilliseptica]MCZ4324666.1 hypothetical protein [Pseudomonas anguilliseptica]
MVGLKRKSAFLILIILCAAGCDNDKKSKKHFYNMDVSNIVPLVDEPYDFELPAEKSYEITVNLDDRRNVESANVQPFNVHNTKGKWQVWITHNVWSNNSRTASYIDRNYATARILLGIKEARDQNKLDFDINFVQIDKISYNFGAREAAVSKNISLSPPGGLLCGRFFFSECVDRYVISPYSRFKEKGTVTQHEWLTRYIAPVKAGIQKEPYGQLSALTSLGFLDERSEYWDRIDMMAFIVNPDGKVMDAIVPLTNTGSVSPVGVLILYLAAAELGDYEFNPPGDNFRTDFKENMFSGPGWHAYFGGDAVDRVVDTMTEVLGK